MRLSARLPILTRLRVSTRLSVLVLLVFALKIASAAACAKHDYADMRFGQSTGQVAVVDAADQASAGDSASLEDEGTCSHCNAHHAAAVPNEVLTVSVPRVSSISAHPLAFPPNLRHSEDLRPPIA